MRRNVYSNVIVRTVTPDNYEFSVWVDGKDYSDHHPVLIITSPDNYKRTVQMLTDAGWSLSAGALRNYQHHLKLLGYRNPDWM